MRKLLKLHEIFLIWFDQCAYDTRIAGKHIMKPNRLLSTWRCLSYLVRSCSRDHVHGQLCGRTLLDRGEEGAGNKAGSRVLSWPDGRVGGARRDGAQGGRPHRRSATELAQIASACYSDVRGC